jgi:integrase
MKRVRLMDAMMDARGLRMLTDSRLKSSEPGVYSDKGGAPGLMLRIEVAERADPKTGKLRKVVHRRWFLRLVIRGRVVERRDRKTGEVRKVAAPKDIGLGAAVADGDGGLSLTQARELARQYRQLARLGIDPAEHRAQAIEAERERAAADAARRVRFREVCEEYVAAHAGSLKNPKHRQRSENSLKEACAVVVGGRLFGEIPVADITTEHVLGVLKPLWMTTTESASRLRGRIERVLASAIARGLRGHPNPAGWRDNLQALLPPARRIAPVEHHAALAYSELPAFMAALAAQPGMGAPALTFAILTAARSGEVRGMTWGEVDLDAKVWTVPAARMKAKREHRVPLSDAALAILQARLAQAGKPKPDALVFPGLHKRGTDHRKPRPPLSDMTLTAVLRRMAGTKPPTAQACLTAHGFRSTFRDWSGEQTSFPREVAEAALAHVVADKVEAAYARGDLFAKRTKLMAAWASYCGSASARSGVVDIAKAKAKRTKGTAA